MANNMTLYSLSEQMALIEATLEANGGELTPELESAWEETRESLIQKVDNYNALVQKLKAYSDNIKAEKARIDAIKKVADNSLARIKAHIKDTMERFGLKSIDGNFCKMYISTRKATEVDEEAVLAPYLKKIEALRAKLPDYVKLEVGVNRTALAEACKKLPEGTSMPGVTTKDSTSLTIK